MGGVGGRRGCNRRGRAERGSATVWVLALAAVLAVLGAGCVAVGVAVVARHRAGTAADLAALAGAGRAAVGDAGPCRAAEQVAGANGATVDGCDVRPNGVVAVRASVAVRLGPLGSWRARAVARAGPAPPEDGVTGAGP